MITPLWQNFFAENPLATFEPDSDDLTGWNSDTPVFAAVIEKVRPKLIIEVGSWKGMSAIHMAKLAPEAHILCIDTWLGSPEMLSYHSDLRRVHGWPHVYHTFASNVVRHVGRERICPLPMSSIEAATVLLRLECQADLIYIDAAHEYRSVVRDLECYWPLVRPGGILFGDDYVHTDVQMAVRKVLPPCEAFFEKYVVEKPV